MALDPELLKILASPACKTPVEYKEKASELVCGECHRHYAVKDDIPNMLIDEARIAGH